MKLEYISVLVAILGFSFILVLAANQTYLTYEIEYGVIVSDIPPQFKFLIDNQYFIFGLLIGLSTTIIIFRWEKFVKNTQKVAKYLN